MSLKERMIEGASRLGYRLLRAMVLGLSDRTMARLLRAVERLAYAVSGDPALKAAVAEMADIFESGPPFTTTVRKLFAPDETKTVVSAIKQLTRPSPYGAA